MSNAPSHLKYAKSHEWVEAAADGTCRIGISDHAQDLLGDMVFIELPEVGQALNVQDECAVVESVKAASDVYSPLTGEVVAVNEALVDGPDLVNRDPYGEGWLFTIKSTDSSELDDLLSADEYIELNSEDDD